MADLRQLNDYGEDVKTTTLYVRSTEAKDRAQELGRDDILNHFSAFGDVTSVRLRKKRKRRSHAFVKFTQPESAAKALQTKIHIIAGRRVEIDVAHNQYHECFSLLDLNNDCLFGIFSEKCLSIEDLCSLAQTCRRLKEIAGEVFRRQYKKCDLSELIPYCSERTRSGWVWNPNYSVTVRILVNFGSMISELVINRYLLKDYNKLIDILDSITRYCRDSLDSLTLVMPDIPESIATKLQPIFNNLQKLEMRSCTYKGVSKELFTDCPAMVELVVIFDADMTFITKKTFPVLQHFVYRPMFLIAEVNVNFKSFLSRHQNLRVLNIWGCDGGSSLPQSIAANCRQLEQLQCYMPKDSTFDLSNLGRLKKLRIDFSQQSVTKSSLGWNKLHFLVELKLEKANVDPEFVRCLSQLKELQVLELWYATGIQNLQQIGDMNQLTKLIIFENDENFDLVRLIRRLGNLKYLTVKLTSWKWMDTKTYLRIVEIVEKRSDKSKIHFQLYHQQFGQAENDVFYQKRHLVEMDVYDRF